MLDLPAELVEPARNVFHVYGRITGYRRKHAYLKVMAVAERETGSEDVLSGDGRSWGHPTLHVGDAT